MCDAIDVAIVDRDSGNKHMCLRITGTGDSRTSTASAGAMERSASEGPSVIPEVKDRGGSGKGWIAWRDRPLCWHAVNSRFFSPAGMLCYFWPKHALLLPLVIFV